MTMFFCELHLICQKNKGAFHLSPSSLWHFSMAYCNRIRLQSCMYILHIYIYIYIKDNLPNLANKVLSIRFGDKERLCLLDIQ